MLSLPLNIERSITIAKPVDEVFKLVADFNSWKLWSPWLCQEPDCPVTITGAAQQVGHAQQWDGKRIGSGEIKLTSVEAPHRLDYALTFLKPWKSQSAAVFLFTPENGGTKVTWQMQGRLPMYMFLMRNLMAALVANDFERGLAMLKERAETGAVASKLVILGEVPCNDFYFVGKRRACEIKEVGSGMEKDFKELFSLIQTDAVPPPEFSFSLYHQFDLAAQRCEYTSGFAYSSPPAVKAGTLVSGQIPHHTALRIEHYGTYRHLGNAWAAMQGLLRANRQKASKKIPMYEIYVTFPGQVPDSEIKTLTHLPLR